MRSDRISFFPADHAPPMGDGGIPVADFVDAVARQLGQPRAALTSSGRAAMTQLFSYLRLTREDEVFVATTFDYPNVSSCVTCTIFNFAKPSRVLTSRTRLIFVIHEFGVPHPQTPQLKAEAARRGIPLVEDCAHTIDSRASDGWHVGSLGDWAIVSLPKVFATTAGGMLAGPAVPEVEHPAPELMAAADRAAADWPDWPHQAQRRRMVFAELAVRFAALGLHPVFSAVDQITPWFFPVTVRHADALLRAVRANKIDCGRWHGSDVLVFPCHQFLTVSHLDRMVDAVSGFMRGTGV